MKSNNTTKYLDDFRKQLLLLILPFYGYLVAFIFEQSYTSYFGIPSYLIKITIENIILAVISVFSGLLIFILLSDFVAPILNFFYKGRKNPISKAVFITLIEIVAFSSILLPFINITLLKKFLAFLCLAVYLSFYNFIVPIIFQKKDLSYTQKLEMEDKAIINRVSLMDIVSQGNRNLSLLLLMAIIFLVLSSRAGSYFASIQKDFLIYQVNGIDNVIIREYSQNYIAVEIDSQTKVIKNNITLIPNTTQIMFQLEKTGRLIKK